jgi:hypothetical protein
LVSMAMRGIGEKKKSGDEGGEEEERERSV